MANFLIHPLSLMASQVLEDLNHDIERQESLEKGQPFAKHARSLDLQIHVHKLSLAERSHIIGELMHVFLKYVKHPDKLLARVALNYLNMLAFGAFDESEAESAIVSNSVQLIRNTYKKTHQVNKALTSL